ncbi:AP-4 complex subunit beta-1 [Amphibalanus amphitrite]|uniref:AP-4 complex subunit beta-1 n=1 Tax=Amphibalanus amphitrite TaxID=1232801 RepID=A0A6A4X4R0_AMPAM|nr:AP-4 complex subunit beta-1 [Amphibalanus amphitrite]
MHLIMQWQLCQLMNTDSDEPRIVQPSIKLLSSHQPLTRIVVMTLVQRHVGRNPDIMPQATNALLKCAVDPNPAVRRAAVSTLARMPDSGDITQPVIAAALRDPHPSVQRAAAVACRVFPRTTQNCHIDHIDELYRLIRSDDALLVHACLTTLDVILAAEGGVVINRAMVRHLSSRSRSLPDAVLVDVLRLLCRYQPASDEERLAVMNRLDWVLASPRPHLIEAALELFFHLCSGDLSHLRADAVSRAAGALCSPGNSPREWRWAVLQLVRSLGTEHHAAFAPHYRYFIPRPSDGETLSVQMIQFLWRLTVPSTASATTAAAAASASTASPVSRASPVSSAAAPAATVAPAVVRELTTCLTSPPLRESAAQSLLRVAAHRPELAAAVVEPLCRLVKDDGGGNIGGNTGRNGIGGGNAVGNGLGNNIGYGNGNSDGFRDGFRSGVGDGASDLPSSAQSGAAVVAGALNHSDLAPLSSAARRRLLSTLLSSDLESLPAHALCRLLEALGRWGGALPTVAARLRRLAHSGESGEVRRMSDNHGALGCVVDDVGSISPPSCITKNCTALRAPSVRLALLETVARLFIYRPAELQITLGVLMERAISEGGEVAATAARLYAALQVTEGRELMDGEREEDEREEGGERTPSVSVTPT